MIYQDKIGLKLPCCCPLRWLPLIRCSRHNQTNGKKNYTGLFDCIQYTHWSIHMKWRADHRYSVTYSHVLNNHHSLCFLFFFSAITDLTFLAFLSLDTACVWSCSSLRVFPSHVERCVLCLFLHIPRTRTFIYVCVSVSPLSGVLCSVFVCSSVWACERQTQSTLFTFCHKPHTARARRSHLKLICMLDQLFTNKLQMHVCQCIIRGWHVALSRRIGLTACYAIHSKHIFTDGICLISEFTCTDMRICTFTFQCRVTHRKHWLIYWYSHARLHYTHIQ